MTIKFKPGDIVVIPDQGQFEIASVHLDGVRPLIKYTDGTHSSIRTITQNIEEGAVELQKKESMKRNAVVFCAFEVDRDDVTEEDLTELVSATLSVINRINDEEVNINGISAIRFVGAKARICEPGEQPDVRSLL